MHHLWPENDESPSNHMPNMPVDSAITHTRRATAGHRGIPQILLTLAKRLGPATPYYTIPYHTLPYHTSSCALAKRTRPYSIWLGASAHSPQRNQMSNSLGEVPQILLAFAKRLGRATPTQATNLCK